MKFNEHPYLLDFDIVTVESGGCNEAEAGKRLIVVEDGAEFLALRGLQVSLEFQDDSSGAKA